MATMTILVDQASRNEVFAYMLIGFAGMVLLFAVGVQIVRWVFRIDTIVKRLDEIRDELRATSDQRRIEPCTAEGG